MKVTPTHYTGREGASWQKWTGGEIDLDKLPANKCIPWIRLKGVEIHSFAFFEEEDIVSRYDVMNGVTHEFRV